MNTRIYSVSLETGEIENIIIGLEATVFEFYASLQNQWDSDLFDGAREYLDTADRMRSLIGWPIASDGIRGKLWSLVPSRDDGMICRGNPDYDCQG